MLNSYEIENMNKESMENVVQFFQKNTQGTAKEIGASGSFLRSLVNRHFLTVIGKEMGDFFAVGNGLYRRAEANIYAMAVPVDTLWNEYVKANHLEGDFKRYKALRNIQKAKDMLEVAETMLSMQ